MIVRDCDVPEPRHEDFPGELDTSRAPVPTRYVEPKQRKTWRLLQLHLVNARFELQAPILNHYFWQDRLLKL